MKNIKLAVIGGDGIGPDVVAEGIKVLDVIAKKYDLSFEKTSFLRMPLFPAADE